MCITSVETLSKKLSPSYILGFLCLKNHVNHLVNLLIAYMNSNTAKDLTPTQCNVTENSAPAQT